MIYDKDLAAAIAKVDGIENWREEIAERMFLTKSRLFRIIHSQGKTSAAERAEVIKQIELYATKKEPANNSVKGEL